MRSPAKAAPLKWRACCVHTQSTHHIKVSYSKIKSKARFPKAQQPLLLLFFYKIYPSPEVADRSFPQQSQLLAPVLKAAELEAQGPRTETCWEVYGGGCKAAASTVRAHQIFLNPGNRDQGGEPPCSPLLLGKQKSETCLSQLSRSLKNKRESN